MPARAYHHGDLARALLDAAVAAARTGGPDAVTVREVARRSGVTASAVYRHYADRDALLAAVARSARQELAVALLAGRDGVAIRRDPGRRALERLQAIGAAYVRFAAGQPNLLATAFLPLRPPPGRDDPDAFAVLVDALRDLVAAGELDDAHLDDATILCWTAVHGVAQLASIGALAEPTAPSDAAGSPERAFGHLWSAIAAALGGMKPTVAPGTATAARSPRSRTVR